MTFSILVLAIRLWYKQTAFGKDDSFFIAAAVSLGVVLCTYRILTSTERLR